MKVIVIGGEGTIGRPVADALSARHEVVRVGRNSGDYRADIASREFVGLRCENCFETRNVASRPEAMRPAAPHSRASAASTAASHSAVGLQPRMSRRSSPCSRKPWVKVWLPACV